MLKFYYRTNLEERMKSGQSYLMQQGVTIGRYMDFISVLVPKRLFLQLRFS